MLTANLSMDLDELWLRRLQNHKSHYNKLLPLAHQYALISYNSCSAFSLPTLCSDSQPCCAPSDFLSIISPPLIRLMLTNLWYVAVNKAVFVIHNEVFQILWWKHPALPRVTQTRLLQQLPAALEGLLSRRPLNLLLIKTMQHEWTRGEKKRPNVTHIIF